jgi:hypothetical protein
MKRLVSVLFMGLLSLNGHQAQAQNFWQRITPPNEQGQLRNEKSVTVGLPLSLPFDLPSQAQYRLGERWLIGGGLTAQEKGKDDQEPLFGAGHWYKTKSHIATAYVEYYVSGKSGFHIGCGIEARMGKFTEIARDSTGHEQESANGSYQAIYGGPSFGWTWIWNNGITFGFDLSKRKQFQSEIRGETMSISAPNTLDRVSAKEIPERVPGMVMLGYSF